jgi:hypothetical protein
MSVNSMVEQFLGPPSPAAALNPLSSPVRELEQTAKKKVKPPPSGLGAAMKAIVTYIPAEIVAAYIPIVDLLREIDRHLSQWVAFWFFLVATPITVLITVAAKRTRRGDTQRLGKLSAWPWWPMIAATLSFLAWSVALPGSVMNDLAWFRPAMGAIAVIMAAFIVGLLSPVFGPGATVRGA